MPQHVYTRVCLCKLYHVQQGSLQVAWCGVSCQREGSVLPYCCAAAAAAGLKPCPGSFQGTCLSCQACPPGTYQNLTLRTAVCKECNPGQTSRSGSTAEEDCKTCLQVCVWGGGCQTQSWGTAHCDSPESSRSRFLLHVWGCSCKSAWSSCNCNSVVCMVRLAARSIDNHSRCCRRSCAVLWICVSRELLFICSTRASQAVLQLLCQ
jgi:hypothetical protein